jgi:hypothetical protein
MAEAAYNLTERVMGKLAAPSATLLASRRKLATIDLETMMHGRSRERAQAKPVRAGCIGRVLSASQLWKAARSFNETRLSPLFQGMLCSPMPQPEQ